MEKFIFNIKKYKKFSPNNDLLLIKKATKLSLFY